MKNLLTQIPKKLKKMLCLGLVCVLTIVTLLGGSASKYYAADNYEYATWTTIRINQSTGNNSALQELYASTKEEYEWAVTSYADPTGGSSVQLTGHNVSVNMLNGVNNTLNKVGTKRFTISNIVINDDNSHALFWVDMTYETYVTRFSGYTKIIK